MACAKILSEGQSLFGHRSNGRILVTRTLQELRAHCTDCQLQASDPIKRFLEAVFPDLGAFLIVLRVASIIILMKVAPLAPKTF